MHHTLGLSLNVHIINEQVLMWRKCDNADGTVFLRDNMPNVRLCAKCPTSCQIAIKCGIMPFQPFAAFFLLYFYWGYVPKAK